MMDKQEATTLRKPNDESKEVQGLLWTPRALEKYQFWHTGRQQMFQVQMLYLPYHIGTGDVGCLPVGVPFSKNIFSSLELLG